MWGLKTTTVQVVMEALGTIKKDIENYSNKIPGNINIHELQNITLLSTAYLLRRVLCIKQKPSLPPKVHSLDSDVEREIQSPLHQYILYNSNNNNNNKQRPIRQLYTCIKQYIALHLPTSAQNITCYNQKCLNFQLIYENKGTLVNFIYQCI